MLHVYIYFSQHPLQESSSMENIVTSVDFPLFVMLE